MIKRCSKCREEKPLDDFNKGNRFKDKLQPWCRACQKVEWLSLAAKRRRARYYRANKERLDLQNRDWAKRNPERRKLIANAYNQRRRAGGGVPIEAWLDRLEEFNFHCGYCLRPSAFLEQEHMFPISKGGLNDIENIIPACRECNATKGRKTLLELITRD